MEKVWILDKTPKEEHTQLLNQHFNLPLPILNILVSRGYDTKEKLKTFLHPETKDYHDPFLMKDMDKAVERINLALIKKEKITIWGDYDVDGITSTSVLYLFLKKLGADISYVIPNREIDGYGLNNSIIDELADKNVKLIITVDCGITSIEQSLWAKEKGIDIVISDHHEPAKNLPEACAVIDPKRKDCEYPFKHLAGVGVAYKLVQAILIKNNMPITQSKEYLDLVTIGTAADIVPLVGENRKIMLEGLVAINKTSKLGLDIMLKKLHLDNKKIKVGNIIFGLAPRLNAAGRMGDAKRGVKLLTASSKNRAKDIVEELENENNRRKEYDQKTLNEAIVLKKDHFSEDDYAIIVYHENWHVGVIGIVASRLVEKYHKPSIVVSIEDGVGKGSCRSIPGINLHEVLKGCDDLLLQYGGHEYAAGMEIKEENIAQFKVRLNQVVKKQFTREIFQPKIKINQTISLDQIDKDLIKYLKNMEPYGHQNSQPIFASYNVEIAYMPRIVGTKHLKLKFKQENVLVDAIGFNLGYMYQELIQSSSKRVNIAYHIEENTWNNTTYVQLKLKDLKIVV